MNKKICLIDADLLDGGTRHPNIALMKISGYHKANNDQVCLLISYTDFQPKYFDVVYVSKVFSFTKVNSDILQYPNVKIGGTGFFEDGGDPLPSEVEHFLPDYTLYDEYIASQIAMGKRPSKFADYVNFSIGFATRGCFRRCDFCVNKKYEKAFRHSEISEWLDPMRPKIYLWDDNIFAYTKWSEVFDELDAIGKPFQFRQGLDIRLLTKEKAERLNKSNYYGDIIFAFDHIEEAQIIEEKLTLWRQFSKKGTKLYVLCGYDSQDEMDIENTFERIRIVMKHKCLPYIMRYEKYNESKYRSIYIQLARWCNQPQFFKKKSFRQYCEANQYYHKNPNTLCEAYRSMLEFEKEFPDIARKYYDIRYDEM